MSQPPQQPGPWGGQPGYGGSPAQVSSLVAIRSRAVTRSRAATPSRAVSRQSGPQPQQPAGTANRGNMDSPALTASRVVTVTVRKRRARMPWILAGGGVVVVAVVVVLIIVLTGGSDSSSPEGVAERRSTAVNDKDFDRLAEPDL